MDFRNLGLGELDLLVISIILVFLLFIALFIIMALYSRMNKIRRDIFLSRNIGHIESTLFAIAFDGRRIRDFQTDPEYIKNWKRKVYREQFLTELIKLRRLYGGEIAQNLRKAYAESGLVQLSFEKIRGNEWHLKCAGIQELSEMEVKKAIPIILEHTKSANETVKMVALIEVIHLKGLKGLEILREYPEPLNDWIQLNLLDSIRSGNITEVPDFGYMLRSPNESIVLFGMRLISMFHQSEHVKLVRSFLQHKSRQLQEQAQKTVEVLSETSDEHLR